MEILLNLNTKRNSVNPSKFVLYSILVRSFGLILFAFTRRIYLTSLLSVSTCRLYSSSLLLVFTRRQDSFQVSLTRRPYSSPLLILSSPISTRRPHKPSIIVFFSRLLYLTSIFYPSCLLAFFVRRLYSSLLLVVLIVDFTTSLYWYF